MSQQNPANESRDVSQMTQFGIFYPRGYLVVAFPDEKDARQVQRDLMTGGYEEADCRFLSSEEVAAAAERNLAEHTGFLARLGWADEALQAHLDATKQGSAFLLIYAPTDTEVSRALNVTRCVPFKFAHRYHRFAIEELK